MHLSLNASALHVRQLCVLAWTIFSAYDPMRQVQRSHDITQFPY